MATETTALQVPKQNLHEVVVRIIGTSELIVHKFSAKSIKQIEDIQAKKAKTKSKRKPEDEYNDCFTDGQMAIKTQTRAITSGMVNLQVFPL